MSEWSIKTETYTSLQTGCWPSSFHILILLKGMFGKYYTLFGYIFRQLCRWETDERKHFMALVQERPYWHTRVLIVWSIHLTDTIQLRSKPERHLHNITHFTNLTNSNPGTHEGHKTYKRNKLFHHPSHQTKLLVASYLPITVFCFVSGCIYVI